MNEYFDAAIRAALEAGEEILAVYESDFAVDVKDDKSPLTLADQRAHDRIAHILKPTGLPLLSEEGRQIPYSERGGWKQFWMVDPLDGTKEFVKRNGEFTVNIALIKDQKAHLGIIYVPVKRELYFGSADTGSFKVHMNGHSHAVDYVSLLKEAVKLPQIGIDRPYTAVGSRSHMSPETEAFFEDLKQTKGDFNVISMGSSLKICLVAEGAADVYPRFAPTMEWDTAAGHAIVKGSGKNIIDRTTGREMLYNKENLLNNWFLVT